MQRVLLQVKENKSARKTDRAKTKSVRGIPKLIDANFAGTKKSDQCSLILCEEIQQRQVSYQVYLKVIVTTLVYQCKVSCLMFAMNHKKNYG